MRPLIQLALTLPIVLSSCAMDESTPSGDDNRADSVELSPLVIDESSNGEVVDVIEGQDLIISLASNPSTGLAWVVTVTDRSLGFPIAEDFVIDESGPTIGGGGLTQLTWATKGFLPLLGVHELVLEHRSSADPAEAAEDSFAVTINIIAEPAISDTLLIDESGNGQSFDVIEGEDVIVQLPSNPSTGANWVVTVSDRSFGFPVDEEFISDTSGPVGSGGITQLTWNTQSFLPLIGEHFVKIEKLSPGETSASEEDTFTFTVNILEEPSDD